jgi:hypothetical protein
MNLLWASFNIFCLYKQVNTLLRCEDQLPYTRTRDRDLYHFRRESPDEVELCSNVKANAKE